MLINVAEWQENPMQIVRDMELLGDWMYGQDSEKREETIRFVSGFTNDIKFLDIAKFVLKNSKQTNALMIACQTCLTLVTEFWKVISKDDVLDMRNSFLSFLANELERLSPVLINSLIRVPCRITKLGYLDSEKFRDITSEISKFLKHTTRHCIVGLKMLSELISDINHYQTHSISITHYRKLSYNFRDNELREIFTLASEILWQIEKGSLQTSDENEREVLFERALQVLLNCFNFDFMGRSIDEGWIDLLTLQLPSSQRSIFESRDPNCDIIQLLFKLFLLSKKPVTGALCIEVLTRLAMCRAALFSSEKARVEYFSIFCRGTLDILKNHLEFLKNESIYFHFCRLLLALRINFQIPILAEVDSYKDWIHEIANFTWNSFQSWETTSKSINFLIALQARFANSFYYLRNELPKFISEFIPEIARGYIFARIQIVRQCVENETLEDIFDANDLEEHLQNLPILCRHNYSLIFKVLSDQFDPLAEKFKTFCDKLSSTNFTKQDCDELNLVEAEISQFIYLFSAIISSATRPNADRNETLTIDAQLCSRVFNLVELINFRVTSSHNQQAEIVSPPSKYLDLALMNFFQHFHKFYVTYHQIRETKPPIFVLLTNYLGTETDAVSVVTAIISKIVFNLNYWSKENSVLSKTLDMFAKLSDSFLSSKILTQIESSKQIIFNHTADHFPFLIIESNARLRTKFYSSLARIVFSGENIDKFEEFMKPFDETFHQIENEKNFKSPVILLRTIGLCCDLRGIVRAAMSRESYLRFYEQFFPDYFKIYLRLYESQQDRLDALIPMLRFMIELVLNRSHRLDFDKTSVNGIMLFRSTHLVLETFGYRILNVQIERGQDLYNQRYKGIALTMQILSNVLCGDYVQFGVFKLYNDCCLEKSIQIVIRLIMAIPVIDMIAYTKVSKVYFQLLEGLFRSHISIMVECSPDFFKRIVTSLLDGIQNPDPVQSSSAACAIDHICTYIFTNKKKKSPPEALEKLEKHFSDIPGIFEQYLTIILNNLLFNHIQNQFSMARPLLPLISIQFGNLENYIKSLAAIQPDNLQRIESSFRILLEDFEPKLSTMHREKFVQKFSFFKKELTSFCIRPREVYF